MYKRIINPNMLALFAVIAVVASFAAVSFALSYPRLFFCTVTFDTDHGAPADAQTIGYGDSLDAMPHTEREYNTFGGWFFDKEHQKQYKGEPIKGDLTLYAKWDTIFTETFFTDYSDRLASAYGEPITVFNEYLSNIEGASLGVDFGSNTNLTMFACGGVSPYSGEIAFCIAFILDSLESADKFYEEVVNKRRYFFDNGNYTYIRKDVLHLLVTAGNENTFLGTITETEDFVFAVDETGTNAALLRYKKDADEPTIPEVYNGLPVSGIGAYAFYDKGLSKINLNGNLKYIGKQAFAYCGNLSALSIPAGIEQIANGFIAGSDNIRTIELNGAKGLEIYDGALYDNRNKVLLKYIGEDVASYTVREGTAYLGDFAFSDRGALISVNLPESIKMIHNGVFSGCYSLLEVDIPKLVIEIGTRAFSCSQDGHPSALHRVGFALSGNLEIINEGCFADNPNLDNIVIPNKLTSIELSSFANCTGLTSIVFEEGSKLDYIYDEAFSNCNSLREIALPDSVTTVYSNAFLGCSSLISVNLNAVSTLYEYAFAGCTALKTVTFANGSALNEIPSYCFQDCYSLADLVLPDSLQIINQEAFSGCRSLTYLDLGGVKEVRYKAFYDCDGIKEILFSDSLEAIQSNAFEGCDKITKMVLPSKAFTGNYGFLYGMNNIEEISVPILTVDSFSYNIIRHYLGAADAAPLSLKKITINNEATQIPEFCFNDLYNVVEIRLPDSVVDICNNAFAGCSSLETVNVPNNLKTIGDFAFADCVSLTDFDLPAGLESIGFSAFFGDSSLRAPVFPQGLKKIDSNAYDGCTQITSVYLPEGLESVGYNIFNDCTEIEEMSVPLENYNDENRKYPSLIQSYCETEGFGAKLKKVTLTSDTRTVPSYAFRGLTELEIIELPSTIIKIESFAFHDIPKLKKLDISMTYNYEDQLILGCDSLEELTVNMVDSYNKETPSYFNYFFTSFGGTDCGIEQRTLSKLIINSPNVSFGARAFVGAKGLQEIVLPDTLTKISERMFEDCESLQTVDIPDGVEAIEKEAFKASGIIQIEIPSKVKSFGDYAFTNCTALKKVVIPQDTALYPMGMGVFSGCVLLEEISFPDRTIWEISPNMFENCTSLKRFNIPEGVQNIGERAFMNSGLEGIDIPYTVISIDWQAFADCTRLRYLNFEDIESSLLKSIGREAFINCALLTKIVLPQSLNEIVGSAFRNCTNLKEVYVLHPFNYHLNYTVMCTNLFQFDANDGVFDNCSAELKIYVPLSNAGIIEDNADTGAKNGVSAYKEFGLGWELYENILFPILPDFEI